jgi:hypothetical protein
LESLIGEDRVGETPGQDSSLASGVQATFQQVGGALGLSVFVTIATRHAASLLSHGTTAAVATTHGYVLAFRVAAGLMGVGALLVLALMEKGRALGAATAGGGGRQRWCDGAATRVVHVPPRCRDREVVLRELTGIERDRVYAEQARQYPGFAEYERQVAGVRTIPVLELTRG